MKAPSGAAARDLEFHHGLLEDEEATRPAKLFTPIQRITNRSKARMSKI